MAPESQSATAKSGIRIISIVRAGILLSALITMLFGLGLVLTFQDSRKALKNQQFAEAVATGTYQLTALTGEYLLYGGRRIQTQWLSTHRSLGRILAAPEFSASAQTLARLRHDHARAKDLFGRAANFGRGEIDDRRHKRLIARILTITQAMVAQASLSATTSRSNLAKAGSRTAWLVSGFFVLLTVSISGFWLVLKWRVIAPIQKLEADISVFGDGSLEHQLPTGRADEIGAVAAAFNGMVERLRNSLVSRDSLIEEVGERQRAEEALAANEALLRLVLDNLPMLITYVGKDQRFRLINKKCAEWYGRPESEVVGKKVAEIHGDHFPGLASSVAKVLSGENVALEDKVLYPVGPVKEVRTLLVPDFGPDGSVRGYIALTEDITERKQAEQALRESEQLANDLATSSSDFFWVTDADFRYTKIWGGDIDQAEAERLVIGNTRWELSDADIETDEHWRGHIEVMRAHQPFRDFEYHNRRETGDIAYFSSSGVPFFDGKGVFLGYRGVGVRVTGRVLAEIALKESEALFQALFDSLPLAVHIKDSKGRYMLANTAHVKATGLSTADIKGKTPHQYYGVELADDLVARDAQVLAERRVIESEVEWRNPEGGLRDGVLTKFPIPSADGTTAIVGTILMDVTERKRAEQALRESEQLANDLATSSSDFFWETDADFRYTKIWGGDIDQTESERLAIGKTRWELADADIETDEHWRGHIEVMRAHQPFRDFQHNNRQETGEYAYFSSSGVPNFDGKGVFLGYRGVGVRVTGRVLAEIALKESEAKWSGMLSISPDAIVACNESQEIVVFNQGAEKLFGYTPAEIIGRPLETLLPEGLRAGHRQHVRNFAASDTSSRLMNVRGEISALRKDGNKFPAEASISKLQLGEDMLFTVMLHDVTERKETQRSIIQAKEAAEVADRAKSEFLANMSHELRTPLNAIIGFAEIIKDQHMGAAQDARYREYAGHIFDSGSLLLGIINDILDLSKIEAGKHELEEQEIDIGRLFDATHALIKGRAKDAGVTLAVKDGLQGAVLLADQRMIKQMLLNLLVNAVKFTPSGGRVELSATRAGDGSLHFTVADTGIGMKAEDIPTALSAFGQIGAADTRSTDGTGLGLPIAVSMAELHGGTISIDSKVGAGTTATIHLPKERLIDR